LKTVTVIPPWQKYLVQKLPCYTLVGEATPAEVEQNSLLKYTVYFTFIPLLAAKLVAKIWSSMPQRRPCSGRERLPGLVLHRSGFTCISVFASHAEVELEVLFPLQK